MTSVLLAIDTSAGTAVSVLVDGKVAVDLYEANTMQHAEQIGIQIAKALEAAKVKPSDITAVAVGIGPGPFTGLRVGIAAAKMFAQGARVRLFGVGSLDAIAYSESLSEPTLVLTDARRSEVYFGLYSSKTPEGVPKVVLGPGVKKQSELEAELAASGQRYQFATSSIRASNIGLLALAKQIEGTAEQSVIANYLRAPDAVPAKGKKVSG